jgi:hypothetical protein
MPESPVLCPYSHGSIAWPVMSSTTRNRPIAQSNIVHPGSTANATIAGNAAAIIGPM